jgi:hypothetical protein
MEPVSQEAEESARERLRTNLDSASPFERSEYLRLLSKERDRLTEINNGKQVEVGYQRSEELLNQARQNVATGNDHMSRNDRLRSVEKAWNKATTKDGRPPIGGAQDD